MVLRRSRTFQHCWAIGIATLAFVAVSVSPIAAEQQPVPWQLDARHLNADEAWKLSQGESVAVAVIDSGVAADHPDLQGQVLPGTGFVGAQDDRGTTDASTDSHGTAIAGLIAGTNSASGGTGVQGLAPKAKILPVRVTFDAGSEPGTIAQGIVWAADNGARVINISLGLADPDPALRAAVEYALSRDSVVVASAGNTGHQANEPMYPASFPGVISVTGTDENNNSWKFSQHGKRSGIAAPSTDIYSSNNKGQYVRAEGTSYGTAYVSAAAALVRGRYPHLTAAQVVRQLVDTATPKGDRPHDERYGYGLLDPVAALTEQPDTSRANNPLIALQKDTGDGSALLWPIVGAAGGTVGLVVGGWFAWRRGVRVRLAWNRPTKYVLATVVVGAATVGAAVLLWPEDSKGKEEGAPPVANYSWNMRVCLLDNPADAASAPATDAAWQAVQEATRTGGVNSQRLAIPPGAPDAATYLASLTQRQCTLIITASGALDEALKATAGANPTMQFVAVNAQATAPNVRTVPGDSPDLRAAVADAIAQARKAHPPTGPNGQPAPA